MTSINRDSSIIFTGISYRWHFLWGILLKFLLISLFFFQIILNFSNMVIFFSNFFKFASPWY